MEINITHLLDTDMYDFAHSAAEGGQNAGPNTWKAALNGPRPLLKTEEEREAFHEFIDETGAWSAEERAHWTDNEEDALFLQFIAGDVRECPATLDGVNFYEREEAEKGGEFKTVWYYDTPSEPDFETGPHASRSEAYRVASSELVGYNQTRRAESLDEIDWTEYEIQASEGQISGRLYRSDSGEIFYQLGN
jgi:hypothetical protein